MPAPLAKCAKVQFRRPASGAPHRKHRQGGEDAAGGIQFQGHGCEHPRTLRIAAHRPCEIGRIGGSERRVDKPGRLPVGRKGDTRGVAQHTLLHQFAPHDLRARFQVVDRDPGVDSSPPGGGPGRRRPSRVGWLPPRPPRCPGDQSAVRRRWPRTRPPSPIRDTSSPWPWVEIVSSPSGSIAVWMLKAAVFGGPPDRP